MIPALPWILLFLPLVAAITITFVTSKDRVLSARLSIGAILGSFLLTVIYILLGGWGSRELTANWLEVGNLHVEFGLRLDSLSLMMLLIVSGVGAAIHIYSSGYMQEDRSYSRYFASLSLFSFSMLGIVLANNFVQLFVFWELVGLSSYLLIGFWYERPAAADASKKAFLTNRVGDFGFLLGILMVWGLAGSLNFNSLQTELARQPQLLGWLAPIAGLLIFCGAAAKSAQFPLHVWLPDAMEGPTPVSALIHAATMVAAGVYLLCRVFFLLALDSQGFSALDVIAWVGGITALLAAIIAVQQNDIKRILAYSTLSQLGLMVMAVGCRGPEAAMFHLSMHAFFKALLFLGAGAVIHALHHEQNIWNMGGLRARMPITFWTFLIGTLALSGAPPFSGFFSKDEILLQAYRHSVSLFVLGLVVSLLTTFYMFRLIFVAFLGRPRTESVHAAHDPPPAMKVPLLILALAAIFGGFWGIDQLYTRQFSPQATGHAVFGFSQMFVPFSHPLPALSGLAALLFGYFAARAIYARAARDPIPERLGLLAVIVRNRFYLDQIYAVVIRSTQECIATLAEGIDRWVIAGLLVKGSHGITELTGRALRLFQTGNLQTYAFLFVAGVALLLFLVIGL